MKVMQPPDGGTESVRVVVQARPLLPFEDADGAKNILSLTGSPPSVTLNDGRGDPVHFAGFDDVYDAAIQRADGLHEGSLLTKHVAPLVASVFGGVNATAFAYGQTSAGKSFTMDLMVAQIADLVFERAAGIGSNSVVTVRVGFVEIYKERIRDLVDGTDTPLGMSDLNIQVRERRGSEGGGVFLDGAKERVVANAGDLRKIITDGALLRQTAATGMNSRSSRSHSVITLTVQVETLTDAGKKGTLSAKLHLVDLAGSERAKRTQAGGERFKEGVQINKSLFALAKVISALAGNAKPAGPKKHVPYRDSKLTRLLQDSLGGTARTLLIACVSPASTSREETAGTLRYAATAKSIKNTLKVNVDAHAVEVSDLRAALARARAQVAALASENESLRARLGPRASGTRPSGVSPRSPAAKRRARGSPLGPPTVRVASPRSPEPLIMRRDSSGSISAPESPRPSAIPLQVGLAAAVDLDQPAPTSPVPGVTASPVTSPRQPARPAGAASRLRRRRLRPEPEQELMVEDSPHQAAVDRALSIARTDELRRTFSDRTGRLEREKATLVREKAALQRALQTALEQNKATESALRSEKTTRAAALRARTLDQRRGTGDAARARKERDDALRERDAAEVMLEEARKGRDELRGKVGEALQRVEAIKRELGRDCRVLARSEAQLKTALERSSIMQGQKDSVIARLQAETDVLSRKMRELSRVGAVTQQQPRAAAAIHMYGS